MSITNVMHHLKAAVAIGDPDAMKLLRLSPGLSQMHKLDGNSSDDAQLQPKMGATSGADAGAWTSIIRRRRGWTRLWLDALKRTAR